VYSEPLGCKSDWILCSKAYESAGFLVRCEYIAVHADHCSFGGHGPLSEERKQLEKEADKILMKSFGRPLLKEG